MKLNKKMSRFTAGSLGIVMGISVMSSFPVFADETDPAIFDYDGYSVSCSVTNSWNNTEIISVTLTNTSDITIENWMLYFDPNGQVDSVWDSKHFIKVKLTEDQVNDSILAFKDFLNLELGVSVDG